ncbi:hypothetical protein LCGC14_1087180, partial [marine sediment metagenome]|nr:cobalamin-binding protein [Actinomycetota bacterium]
KPAKIVSLAPAGTEILFALGLGKKVVGVTTFCNFPKEATRKDKIGSFSKPSIEKVVAKKPDLVIATGGMQLDAVKQLSKLNIKVFVIDPKNLEEIIASIKKVGKITGAESKANQVTQDMEQIIDEVKSKASKLAEKQKPKVFFELYHEPLMSAGPNTFISDMIKLAGGKSIADSAREDYPQYSLEVLIKENPEIIIASKGSMADPGEIDKRKGWESVSAVKKGRVYVIDDDLINRPSPRITQGLQEIDKAINP